MAYVLIDGEFYHQDWCEDCNDFHIVNLQAELENTLSLAYKTGDFREWESFVKDILERQELAEYFDDFSFVRLDR